jgi:hypothetical protein
MHLRLEFIAVVDGAVVARQAFATGEIPKVQPIEPADLRHRGREKIRAHTPPRSNQAAIAGENNRWMQILKPP